MQEASKLPMLLPEQDPVKLASAVPTSHDQVERQASKLPGWDSLLWNGLNEIMISWVTTSHTNSPPNLYSFKVRETQASYLDALLPETDSEKSGSAVATMKQPVMQNSLLEQKSSHAYKQSTPFSSYQ